MSGFKEKPSRFFFPCRKILDPEVAKFSPLKPKIVPFTPEHRDEKYICDFSSSCWTSVVFFV